ncbi:zinc finger protein ZPR1 [Plutella xylostella]|uniref:zinc finger protein ZPR1 n=1 Tax=Plutella xylostella TaxID=51655 RepID=UPI00203231B7|nr:zinc finger protein ZPR1 [Plutella xylostella]
MSAVESKPLFRDLNAEDPEPECTEIESMCMNCHANGMTRLLLTRIPYYKNVVIMSFSCEECGYANNEVQPGGAFADVGVRWKLQVEKPEDLNRQVVKSDYTSVKIPELDFEIPAQSQKGEVTTVEGIISRAIAGLLQDHERRQSEHPEAAAQITEFVGRLEALKTLEKGFSVEIEDISGNCFVENPEAPQKDPRCVRTEFKRNDEQNHLLGVFTHDERGDTAPPTGLLTASDPAQHSYDRLQGDEVMSFPTNCPECNAPADTRMKLTHIPHFKEVVIMATTCDACGHRTNEVKSGGGIEDKGVKFEIRVASKDDFSRDILKSETCSMSIPELDCSVGGRALGGRFTTAEGLLRATAEQLADCPGATGDAPGQSGKLDSFIKQLEEVLAGTRTATIVLDDPAGNSYVQSLNDQCPDQPDDGLKVTRYERSEEQNEELGLNDMKTENYQNDS